MGQTDELIHAQRFPPPPGIDTFVAKQHLDLISPLLEPSRQRVAQRLAPLPEGGAHQTAKHGIIFFRNQGLRIKPDFDNSGPYSGSRKKDLRRDRDPTQDLSVNLAPDREGPVRLCAWGSGHSLGHFALHHQYQKREMIAQLKNSKKNGSRNVIGKISRQLYFMVRQNVAKRNFKDVAVNQIQGRMRAQRALQQPSDKRLADLDRPNPARNLNQPARQKPQPWTDLNDFIFRRGVKKTEDRFEDTLMDEKMLT